MRSVCQQKKVVIPLLILVDQLSKLIILKFFSRKVFYNQGIAFGLFPNWGWLIVNLLILLIIGWKLRQKWPQVLILSGGFSNLIDRFFRGSIVDFINLPFFPVFNLADVYICLGISLLLLKNYFKSC